MGVKKNLQNVKVAILLAVLLFLASCTVRQGLSLILDIPEKRPEKKRVVSKEKKPVSEVEAANGREQVRILEKEVERPPIEKTLVWEEAEKFLPVDELGEVDWMEALRQGVIKPRGSIDGTDDPFVFKFNFHFPGSPGFLGAYFPHSAHTQWLACESCHPAIFPQRGTQLSMAQILSGEYCGKCHGKVAFPIAKGCKRCHVKKS